MSKKVKVIRVQHGASIKALFGKRIRRRIPITTTNQPNWLKKYKSSKVCGSTHLWEMEKNSLTYRRLK